MPVRRLALLLSLAGAGWASAQTRDAPPAPDPRPEAAAPAPRVAPPTRPAAPARPVPAPSPAPSPTRPVPAPTRPAPAPIRPAPAPAPAPPSRPVTPTPTRPAPAPAPAGQPDLAVGRIGFEGESVTAEIRNLGAGPAPATRAALFVSGRARVDAPVPRLAPGQTVVVRFPAPPPGSRLQVMVDPDNAVAESNEVNNRPFVITMPGGAAAGTPPPSKGVVKIVPALTFVGQGAGATASVQLTTPALTFIGQPTSQSATVSKTTPTLSFTGAPTSVSPTIEKTTPVLVFVGTP